MVRAEGHDGEANVELVLLICVPASAAFAKSIEEAVTVEALREIEAPDQRRFKGDWMVWMVHRVHLNDPELSELDFGNMHMPPPEVEPRVAPKLAAAIATNTHLQTLKLANADLRKGEALVIGESLAKNAALTHVDLSVNHVDSNAARRIAASMEENTACQIQVLSLDHQTDAKDFGRPVEEAFAAMLSKNRTLCKLGLSFNDAHWRDSALRSLLRNNDAARRRRKGSSHDEIELPVQEKGEPAKVLLIRPGDLAVPEETNLWWQASEAGIGREQAEKFEAYVLEKLALPTASQLQSRSVMPYSKVRVALEAFRSRVTLRASKHRALVRVLDPFHTESEGRVRKWEEFGTETVIELTNG